jgi:phosphocarrier protein
MTAPAERVTQSFTIVNDLGLHARAATKLVQLAAHYPCDVTLSHAGQNANAKSVMGVLLLCGSKGTVIEVTATGAEAAACVKAIGELIASRFGEPS